MPIATTELPAADVVMELPSPDYTTVPPEIDGPYTLPWWATEVVEATFRTRGFTGRRVRVFRLTDAFVCHEGMVFNADGQLYVQEGPGFPQETIVAAHRGAQHALWAGNIAEHTEPVILCKRPTAFNYGHWMIDMLPLAWLLRRRLARETASAARVMLLRTGGPMDAVMEQSLAHVGVPPDRLLWTDYAPRRCRELYVLAGMSDHGKYVSPFVIDCHDTVAADIAGRGWQRLFITRRGGQGRQLRNEAELADIARAAGYTVFDPGSVPLAEQVAAFKDARHVIGAMGAAMTNMVYAPRGALLTVMTPQSMPDAFYWLLCQLRGQRYRDLRCEEVGDPAPAGQPPWARATLMDPDRFRAELLSG